MQVSSVNVAKATSILIDGRRVATSIFKRSAGDEAVAIGPMGLAGDEQADLTVHGGLSKAVYAYNAGHYAFWQTVRAQAGAAAWADLLAPGALGENLTITNFDESQLWIGDFLKVGTSILIVSEPRYPCFKFNHAMGFTQAAKLMMQSGYCGAYLAVHQPGEVRRGDAVAVQPGPREVGVRELFKAKARP
jgi:MOSC domain-containing protein YiiM